MMSLAGSNTNVIEPPQYSSREFLCSLTQCPATDPTVTSFEAKTTSLSPNRGHSNQTQNPSSATSLNHTSTPSPSYPLSNSWPGFGGNYSSIDEIQTAASDIGKSSSASDSDPKLQYKVFRRKDQRVYVFNSVMANEAIFDVQQRKYDSILAWHKANCLPSTSKEVQVPVTQNSLFDIRKVKRKSIPDERLEASAYTAATAAENQISCEFSQTSAFEDRVCYSQQQPCETPPSSTDLLILGDNMEISTDNPLWRMERMTQDSLFEPPSKARYVSSDGNQYIKRDQDRNAKLEKMRTLEQQILSDRARSDWERMVQEHEMIKLYQSQPVSQNFSSHSIVETPYSTSGVPSVHPAYQMNSVSQQIGSAQQSSPVPANGALVGVITNGTLSVERSISRSSIDPPPYNVHTPSDCYLSYGNYTANSLSPQGYVSMSPTISPAYSPIYSTMNGNLVIPKSYPVYPAVMRSVCATEKVAAAEVWMPQTLNSFDAHTPCHKLPFSQMCLPVEDNCVDSKDISNTMFG